MATAATNEVVGSIVKDMHDTVEISRIDKSNVDGIDLWEKLDRNLFSASVINRYGDPNDEPKKLVQATSDKTNTSLQGNKPDVAIESDTIWSEGNQVFRNVEGIRVDTIEAGGDQTFEGITAGKP